MLGFFFSTWLVRELRLCYTINILIKPFLGFLLKDIRLDFGFIPIFSEESMQKRDVKHNSCYTIVYSELLALAYFC